MHRFFLTTSPLKPHQSVDLSPLVRQLYDVLRLQAGEQIVLLDNSGDEFLTQIEQIDRKRAVGLVLSQQPCLAEPSIYLTLYQCSLKADKFEWVLQKCTELGVSRFAPVISERSIVRPAAALLKKYDRWQEILREAAEQCGRGKIPELSEPLSFETAVREANGTRLIAWEEARQEDKKTRRQGEEQSSPTSQFTNLLIGPEGGITQDEANLAQSTGWRVVSLGKRTLRAETAAVAAVARLVSD
ncbi:MAG: 16S rRNA (uracil(1498)-N(3))-methyltransferase [Caldilineaceae bacterium]